LVGIRFGDAQSAEAADAQVAVIEGACLGLHGGEQGCY
jgi:hypothetical protein